MITSWKDDAKCRKAEMPIGFFHPKGDLGNRSRIKNDKKDKDQAEAIVAEFCIGCPVRKECLEYALTIGITEGVIGGTTALQRKRIRRLKLAA